MINLLKSIFISILNVVALYIFIASSFHIFSTGFSYLEFSKIISSGIIVLYFTRLFLKPTARTSLTLKTYTISIIIGILIGIAGSFYHHYSISSTVINPVFLLAWLLYVTWYSHLDSKNNERLVLGDTLPYFELEETSHGKIISDQFKGFYTIFLFYRGNWCPLCMAQIKEIASSYKELESNDINVVLVSPQSHKNSASLAKKYNVNFRFLVDRHGEVSKKLGIFHKNGLPTGLQLLGYDSDTVFPTIIITNKEQKIIFLDQTDNYRIRPEPKTFLSIIEAYDSKK